MSLRTDWYSVFWAPCEISSARGPMSVAGRRSSTPQCPFGAIRSWIEAFCFQRCFVRLLTLQMTFLIWGFLHHVWLFPSVKTVLPQVFFPHCFSLSFSRIPEHLCVVDILCRKLQGEGITKVLSFIVCSGHILRSGVSGCVGMRAFASRCQMHWRDGASLPSSVSQGLRFFLEPPSSDCWLIRAISPL